MFKLQPYKSYVWIFPIYAVIFLGAWFAVEQYAFVVLPVFAGGLLAAEVRSGVAIDSWWRATHPKGTRFYKPIVVWHGFMLVASAVLAGVAIWAFL